MRPYDWYARAKARLEQFLPGLDSDLEVDIHTTNVTPDDDSGVYNTFVLVFYHASNENLHWTMEIRMDDDYIERELEDIVTRIYFQRVE